MLAARSQHGLGDDNPVAGEYFTAEQLLELAWKVAGATMAAIGVPHDDLRNFGNRVAPVINDLVGEYGIAIPESYGRNRAG